MTGYEGGRERNRDQRVPLAEHSEDAEEDTKQLMHEYAQSRVEALQRNARIPNEQVLEFINQISAELDARFGDESNTARKIFIEELTRSLHEARGTDLGATRDLLSNGPPLLNSQNGLLARLPLPEQFQIATDLLSNRDVVLWHNALENHLLNQLHISSPETQQQIAELCIHGPVARSLQLLNSFERLLDTHEEKSSPEHADISRMLQEIIQQTQYPLVRYAAESLLQQYRGVYRGTELGSANPVNILVMQPDNSVRISSDYVASLNDFNVIGGIANPLETVRRFMPLGEVLDNATVLPFDQSVNQEELTILIEQLHRPILRQYIEQKLHVRLDQLSLRSQIQLLHYISTQDNQTMHKFEQLINTSGVNTQQLCESFFAVGEHPEIAKQLLDFVTHASPETVNTVTAAYHSILQELSSIEDSIHDFFIQREDAQSVDTRAVVQETVHRANRILRECIESHRSDEEIHSRLQAVQEDAVRFGAMCKSVLRHHPDIRFEQLKDFSLEHYSYDNFPEEYKENLLEISHQNNPDTPNTVKELEQILRPSTTEEIETAQRNEFIIVKYKNRIASFLRSEQRGEEQHLAALNVVPELQNAGIGGHILLYGIEHSKNNPEVKYITADAFPLEQALTHYITVGFVGKHYTVDSQAPVGGKRSAWVDIVLSVQPQEYALRRGQTVDDLLKLYQEQQAEGDYLQQAEQKKDYIMALIDVHHDSAEATDMIATLLNDFKYTVTRYECLNEECSRRIVGFELTTDSTPIQTAISDAGLSPDA